MNEQVFQFGPNDTLTGVLSAPEVIDTQRPVVLILNAGITHRCGPFRLHVDIARRLAQQGFAAMRMDLSGLGDSRARTDVGENQDRAVLDAKDAMDFVESQTTVDKFIMLGLCSGAYNAHQISVGDSRIVGGVFMDGLAYCTEGHEKRVQRGKLTQPRKWRNAIKRRLANDAMHEEDMASPDASEFFEVDKPADQVAREIQGMMDRFAQLLFIYTEGYEDVSSRSQFEEMFGLVPNDEALQVDYYDNFEHTFRIAAHREVIVSRIAQWCSLRFPQESKFANSV